MLARIGKPSLKTGKLNPCSSQRPATALAADLCVTILLVCSSYFGPLNVKVRLRGLIIGFVSGLSCGRAEDQSDGELV
jgi:hypothetical protein